MKISNKLTSAKNWFNSRTLWIKFFIVLVILGIGFIGFKKFTSTKTDAPSYQTAEATRGTLIVSVSSSGQVSNTNSSTITTQASGVVTKVFIKNGEAVKAGDPIAQIDLDLLAKQKSTLALSSYQSAQNSLANTQSSMYSLQADMFSNWDTFKKLSLTDLYKDPTSANRNAAEFHIPEEQWLASEAKYKNQQNVINQAQTAVSGSWYSYQQSSPTIYAPISGKLNGLSIVEGSVIASSTSTNDTGTPTKIGSIISDSAPLLTFNLTEVDIGSIKVGDKATITLDALSGKTFTGKVISIDTVGTTSSGVTVYPTMIQLDSKPMGILSNMSASASIITNVKDDVILVPVAAVETQNDQSTVRVLKNGQVNTVNVETGLSSATQTEIVSGISEGDMVVTGQTTSANGQTTRATTSVFGGLGGFGGARGAGGGAVRTGR